MVRAELWEWGCGVCILNDGGEKTGGVDFGVKNPSKSKWSEQ